MMLMNIEHTPKLYICSIKPTKLLLFPANEYVWMIISEICALRKHAFDYDGHTHTKKNMRFKYRSHHLRYKIEEIILVHEN